MIQSIYGNSMTMNGLNMAPRQNVTSPIAAKPNVIPFKSNISGDKIALALQAQTVVPMAKTISFGGSLFDKLAEATAQISVCKDEKNGRPGESVGTKTDLKNIIY